jgi:hypothetical protein
MTSSSSALKKPPNESPTWSPVYKTCPLPTPLFILSPPLPSTPLSKLSLTYSPSDADFEACKSELLFLRLQLLALEVQGQQYIPSNADEELSESIKNWKLAWADIDQKTKARREKCQDLLRNLDDSQTISVQDSR